MEQAVLIQLEAPADREVACESSIGEQKAGNIQLTAHTTEAEFLTFRQERDRSLAAPTLLYPSIQVNIDAGHLPTSNTGKLMLKIPINPE